MQTGKLRWMMAVLVALALAVAGCGNDDDSGGGAEVAPTAEAPAATEPPEVDDPEPEPSTPEPDESAPEEPTDPPEDEPEFEPPPTPEPPPEIELTATWRGVTADTITIGVSYLDIEALVDLGFSPATWGDQELVIQALTDDINERGGINGRQVEVIMDKYSPIGITEAEAACLRLTEDNEVFAVLFGFLGPAEVANTCIVGNQETVLVGGTITDERMAEARAPWVNERAPRARVTNALFALLDEEGELQGRSIAIVADASAAAQLEEVAGLVRNFGVNPVLEVATSSAVGDLIAQNQEWSALSERISAAGADTLLLVGNASAGIQNASLYGLDVDVWATDASGLGSNIGSNVEPEAARGVITVAAMTGAQMYESDPRFQECFDAFTSRHPDIEVKNPDTLEEGEPLWFTSLSGHCRFFQLFELLATSAGPDLTHETFAQAIQDAGDFSIAGQPYASFGPDKFSSNDSFQLVAQDPDIGARGELVPISPLRDTTP